MLKFQALFTVIASALTFILMAGTAMAGYPTNAQVSADVNRSDAKAYVHVTVTGKWAEARHASVPPAANDECKIGVQAKGAKKPDGTWYEYQGLAIYRRGADGRGAWRFNRYFVYENSITLQGFEPPTDKELLHAYIQTFSSRRVFLPGTNTAIITAVYNIGLAEDMQFRALGPEDLEFNVVLDIEEAQSTTRLARSALTIRARIIKKNGVWTNLPPRAVGKKKLISTRVSTQSEIKAMPRLSSHGLMAVAKRGR